MKTIPFSVILLLVFRISVDFITGESESDFLVETDNQDLKGQIFHFPNKHVFLDKFGDNEEFEGIFNDTKRVQTDPSLPGDMGHPAFIENPSSEVKKLIEEDYKLFGYNKYLSDTIGLQRRLPDYRNELCFTHDRFIKSLLPTSVIMCFYNEALSVLLRSVYSILKRSPSHLLSEIILIDDFSDSDELKDKLDVAIKNLPKVRLIRLPKREGLIRARLIGSDIAVAPVLTFLDSHSEATEGWLVPLLDRLTRNWKIITIPQMDSIDPDTFAYLLTNTIVTGGFTWHLFFKWKKVPYSEINQDPADSILSPTMPGGMFAIHKDFFNLLGRFDDKFEIWGGENLELSFKAWMCGGKIEITPCSRVAHLERKSSTYPRAKFMMKNLARMGAVWMDEYFDYYREISDSHEESEPEDITSRLELRKELKCKSFDWYMNNVVYIHHSDMFNPRKLLAYGELRNEIFEGTFCLDAHKNDNPSEETPSLYWGCHGLGGNQNWLYTTTGEIRKDEKCLDLNDGQTITIYECHGLQGNQEWEYHGDTGVILSPANQECLTLEVSLGKIITAKCYGELNQRWKFKNDKVLIKYGKYNYSNPSLWA